MCTVALFTVTKTEKQPESSLTEEWIKKVWHRYIQWSTIQPQKRMK